MRRDDAILAVLPLLPTLILLPSITHPICLRTLLFSSGISVLGFVLTSHLIPVIAKMTLQRNICGKDMGKRGTPTEDKYIPEALGIVSGTVFLICAIVSQFALAENNYQQMIYNSAMFSICFMIFLGFTDDVLDLKWRFKLILPTVASLPLLMVYSGSTAVYIPKLLSPLLYHQGQLTSMGVLINTFATVDTASEGQIIELGYLFMVYMGMLAVFCTNAINILAGINGLECGQAYIIACSILFFKVYEFSLGENIGDNQLFAALLILPFIGTSLALLRYNWFPAEVFVGDTFCYFSGMTFAVVGIHGHFSKTLLLLFLPQVFNFLYSIPQLFKVIPCPRHRLPHIDTSQGLLKCSTFPCKKSDYRVFKAHPDDEECPNYTLICLVLRVFGPMKERTLCLTLLSIQIINTALVFALRYVIFNENK